MKHLQNTVSRLFEVTVVYEVKLRYGSLENRSHTLYYSCYESNHTFGMGFKVRESLFPSDCFISISKEDSSITQLTSAMSQQKIHLTRVRISSMNNTVLKMIRSFLVILTLKLARKPFIAQQQDPSVYMWPRIRMVKSS